MRRALVADREGTQPHWDRGILWGIGASLVVLAAVVLFMFDPQTTSFYPPCPFLTLTGFLCPGCGSTRAVHALLHGRVLEAFTLNPLLFIIPPLIALMHWSPRLGLDGRYVLHLRSFLSCAVLLLVLGFGIARNLL